MTTDHHDEAIAHIEAVRAARGSLRDMYREDFRDPRDVARLNADLGDALKLADVHATLAVAQAVDNLADVVERHHTGDVGMDAIADHVTRHQAILQRQRGL